MSHQAYSADVDYNHVDRSFSNPDDYLQRSSDLDFCAPSTSYMSPIASHHRIRVSTPLTEATPSSTLPQTVSSADESLPTRGAAFLRTKRAVVAFALFIAAIITAVVGGVVGGITTRKRGDRDDQKSTGSPNGAMS